MDSVYERRVWSSGWSSWPSGDRAAGKFVWDERDGTKRVVSDQVILDAIIGKYSNHCPL